RADLRVDPRPGRDDSARLPPRPQPPIRDPCPGSHTQEGSAGGEAPGNAPLTDDSPRREVGTPRSRQVARHRLSLKAAKLPEVAQKSLPLERHVAATPKRCVPE